jgi:hypothetical protein
VRCLDQRERRSRGTPAVPYIKLAAVADEQSSTLTLFALNRNLAEPMTIAVVAKGFCDLASSRRRHRGTSSEWRQGCRRRQSPDVTVTKEPWRNETPKGRAGLDAERPRPTCLSQSRPERPSSIRKVEAAGSEHFHHSGRPINGHDG